MISTLLSIEALLKIPLIISVALKKNGHGEKLVNTDLSIFRYTRKGWYVKENQRLS